MVCDAMWSWIWEGIQHSTLPRCSVACSDVALVHSDWRLGNHVVLGGLQSSLLVWTMPLWSPERHASSELIKSSNIILRRGWWGTHTKQIQVAVIFIPQDGYELVSPKKMVPFCLVDSMEDQVTWLTWTAYWPWFAHTNDMGILAAW